MKDRSRREKTVKLSFNPREDPPSTWAAKARDHALKVHKLALQAQEHGPGPITLPLLCAGLAVIVMDFATMVAERGTENDVETAAALATALAM